MPDYDEFSLIDFQRKVWVEFVFLKNLKSNKEFQSFELQSDEKKSPLGCIFGSLLTVAKKSITKHLEKEIAKKELKKFRKEARELITQKTIRDTICESFLKKSRFEIITNEKFVDTVTESLIGVITPEPALFAFIAYEISETGIERFCLEQNEQI